MQMPNAPISQAWAHLVSTTNRRAIPLLPLSIRWRKGWGERPRATLLPAGLPPLPIGWGEGRGEGPSFLRAVVLTRCSPPRHGSSLDARRREGGQLLTRESNQAKLGRVPS